MRALLAIIMVAALAACGGDDDTATEETTTTEQETTTTEATTTTTEKEPATTTTLNPEEATLLRIEMLTSCEALQIEFDTAEENHDIQLAEGDVEMAELSTSYMEAADARMQQIGCY